MNRLVRPIMFAFEPDVTKVFAMAQFGAAGAPTLNTANSKGVCQWAASTQVWKATTSNTSASVTAAESLYGVYNGMSVTGTGIPASTTVSAVNPSAGTLTLSNAATASNVATPLTFSGGQYIVTFGSQYTPFKRLDNYVKLLQMTYNWDVAVNAKLQTSSSPSAPAAWMVFLVSNQSALANQSFTVTGTTATSTSVTALATNGSNGVLPAAITPGMLVSGSGVAAGTYVESVNIASNSMVLSAATTTSVTGDILTITPINPSSVIFQCGTYSGATFTAANPASGEILRLAFDLSRSNAI